MVVSPSGKFYGSEKVLFDYVVYSSLNYILYLPNRGEFFQKLSQTIGNDRLRVFRSTKTLYLKLFWFALLGKIDTLYLNEGGHNKYVLLLAKWFPKLRVVIHLRILEDTAPKRWPNELPTNVDLVTISLFMANISPFHTIQLYDPYPFSNVEMNFYPKDRSKPFCIGIIGRLGYSKGIAEVVKFLQLPGLLEHQPNWKICFFGELTAEIYNTPIPQILRSHPMVELMGFLTNKKEIYEQIDWCVTCG